MTTALTVSNSPQAPTQSRLIPSEHEFQVYQVMARNAAASQLYKGLGGESQIMMIMLAARELGVGPMLALNGGIHCIQGKLEISARLMCSLIRQKGHSVVVKVLNDKECVIEGKRVDNGDTAVVSFTIAEAELAGLVRSGSNWNKYRKDMLYCRALTRIGRQLFADVIGTSYIEGEIEVKAERIEATPCLPEDIVSEETTVSLDEENEKLQQFLSQHPAEETKFIQEYLEKRSKYYQKRMYKTIEECEKDQEKFVENFKKWMETHYQKSVDA